jgi:hypothetical protein
MKLAVPCFIKVICIAVEGPLFLICNLTEETKLRQNIFKVSDYLGRAT